MSVQKLLLGSLLVALGLGVLRGGDRQNTTPEKIHREGTKLDEVLLTFRPDNDRLVAQFPLENKPIQVLENLAAQRIFRATHDDPKDNRWTVTATMTEFEGSNFLLIEQAVRVRR
jgi:hypothetical protein